ncbi:polysaccharide deacetylase family protein [Thermodesulfobacteriota bacterium]
MESFFHEPWIVGAHPDFFGSSRTGGAIRAGRVLPGEGRRVLKDVAADLIFDSSFKPPWRIAGDRISVDLKRLAVLEQDARTLASFLLPDGTSVPALVADGEDLVFAFDPVETIDHILAERFITPAKPVTSYFPFRFHAIPGPVRGLIHKCYMMAGRLAPGGSQVRERAWPVNASVDALRWMMRASVEDAAGPCRDAAGSWPGGKRFAVAVTHDVDTPAGQGMIETLSGLDEARGVRSTWYVVGGKGFKHDHTVLEGLAERGHEIGLHGDVHDNMIALVSGEEVRRRLETCRPFIDRYDVRGFRSPSLYSSPTLRRALREYGLYDSSVPDVDIHSMVAPWRGCGSIRPFVMDGVIQIPLTMPLDDRLLGLGYSQEEIIRLLLDKFERIRELGGVVVVTTHAEPHLYKKPGRIAFYDELLASITGDGSAWYTTMGEIARAVEGTVGNGV